MTKAVIETGGKQYLVKAGDVIGVEKISEDINHCVPLAIIDGKHTKLGNPKLTGSKVEFKITGQTRDQKVTAIRFKAKKRVDKRRGHRQIKTLIEITSIKQ